MRVIKTLIVDDEPVARRILREELEQFHDIEVVGWRAREAVTMQRRTRLVPRNPL